MEALWEWEGMASTLDPTSLSLESVVSLPYISESGEKVLEITP